MTEGSRTPLLVLGTAIAMTTAGAADAALVSTAGSGFVPITFAVGTPNTFSFDLDQNGSNDFSLASDATGIRISELQTGSGVGSFFTLNVSQTADQLSLSNVKHAGMSIDISSSGTAPSNYAALATNFVPSGTGFGFGGTGTLGYLQGTYVAGTTGATVTPASFRLEDFGLVTTAASDAPEPETWVMMIAGFGGIGALRRRARATAAAATC